MKRILVFLLCLLMLPILPAAVAETLPTISYVTMRPTSLDLNADPVAAAIEEVTGYKATYTVLPSENAQEKLYMDLASNVKYDVMFVFKDTYYDMLYQGALMPLDDLLEEYGQNILDEFYPDLWKTTQYEGQTYGIPYTNDRATIWKAIYVRQDVLDELGATMPTTPDELYALLKRIKEETGLIPLTSAYGIWTDTIESGFGATSNTWVEQEDGSLVPYFESQEYQDYIAFMAKLYDEGLIDADWGINTTANAQEKFAGGSAAMAFLDLTEIDTVYNALIANVPDATIDVMLPLEDENGDAHMRAQYALEAVVCIPKTSANAQDAMKWMNLKQDPDNFTYIHIGTEGVHYTYTDGMYAPIMPKFSEDRNNGYFFYTSKNDLEYAEMWLARIRRQPWMGYYYDIINADFDDVAVFDPLRFVPVFESVTKYGTVVNQMAKDFCLQVMMGARSLDDLDAFIAEWDDAGGQLIREETNDWYTNYGQVFDFILKPVVSE